MIQKQREVVWNHIVFKSDGKFDISKQGFCGWSWKWGVFIIVTPTSVAVLFLATMGTSPQHNCLKKTSKSQSTKSWVAGC